MPFLITARAHCLVLVTPALSPEIASTIEPVVGWDFLAKLLIDFDAVDRLASILIAIIQIWLRVESGDATNFS